MWVNRDSEGSLRSAIIASMAWLVKHTCLDDQAPAGYRIQIPLLSESMTQGEQRSSAARFPTELEIVSASSFDSGASRGPESVTRYVTPHVMSMSRVQRGRVNLTSFTHRVNFTYRVKEPRNPIPPEYRPRARLGSAHALEALCPSAFRLEYSDPSGNRFMVIFVFGVCKKNPISFRRSCARTAARSIDNSESFMCTPTEVGCGWISDSGDPRM